MSFSGHCHVEWIVFASHSRSMGSLISVLWDDVLVACSAHILIEIYLYCFRDICLGYIILLFLRYFVGDFLFAIC